MIVTFKNGEQRIYEECNYINCESSFIRLEKNWKEEGKNMSGSLAYLNKEEVLLLEWIREEVEE